MKTIKWGAFGSLAFFILAGCATLVGGGSKQNVTIKSIPKEETFSWHGNMSLTTPTIIPLERKRNYTLRFEKEGYEKKHVLLKR